MMIADDGRRRHHPGRYRSTPTSKVSIWRVRRQVRAAGVVVNDFLQTTNANIYAAGDVCLQRKFAHAADATGRIVVENALRDGRKRLSGLTIPWCTYTDPEIAMSSLCARSAGEWHPRQDFHDPDARCCTAVADGEEVGS